MISKKYLIIFIIICVLSTITLFVFGNNMNDIQSKVLGVFICLSFGLSAYIAIINSLIDTMEGKNNDK